MTSKPDDARRSADRRLPAQADAKGQFAKSLASPNPSGVVSANPTVLSGDGDATPGSGHGRDRNGTANRNTKSDNREGQRVDDLPFAGLPNKGRSAD